MAGSFHGNKTNDIYFYWFEWFLCYDDEVGFYFSCRKECWIVLNWLKNCQQFHLCCLIAQMGYWMLHTWAIIIKLRILQLGHVQVLLITQAVRHQLLRGGNNKTHQNHHPHNWRTTSHEFLLLLLLSSHTMSYQFGWMGALVCF